MTDITSKLAELREAQEKIREWYAGDLIKPFPIEERDNLYDHVDDLIAVAEAARRVLQCITWCQERDEPVSGYICDDADILHIELQRLAGVGQK